MSPDPQAVDCETCFAHASLPCGKCMRFCTVRVGIVASNSWSHSATIKKPLHDIIEAIP